MVKTIKIVNLEKLEQIHGKKFKRHTQMFPEDHVILYMDYVHYVFLVMRSQVLQYFKFNTGLIVIFLFILNDFDGDLSFIFMIYALQSSTKRSLT